MRAGRRDKVRRSFRAAQGARWAGDKGPAPPQLGGKLRPVGRDTSGSRIVTQIYCLVESNNISSLVASDLELVLGALARIHTRCRPRALPVSEGATVSPHQARLLGYLDRDDPAMVTELAESLGVTSSTMSLTLGRLERSGLVSRERDPEDRRVMNVRLTEEGERIREVARPFDADSVDAALLRLRPDERREAVRGLALLADAVEAGS